MFALKSLFASKPRIRVLNRCGLTALLAVGGITQATAANFSWTGTGANSDWGTGQNWLSGAAPASATATVLFFGGTNGLTSNANAAWTLGSMIFNANSGAFTITGTTLTLAASGTVANNSANLQTISNSSISLSGASLWNTGAAGLSVSSTLTGAGSLNKTGLGTLTLSSQNSFTGSTTIFGGTIRLGANGALPTGRPVTVSGTTANGTATLDLNGTSQTIGSLNFAGSAGRANVVNTVSTGTGTLTLGGGVNYSNPTSAANHSGSAVISGKLDLGGAYRTFTVADSANTTAELTINAAIGGTGGIDKTGAGVLVLGGSNTYSGSTTISAGALRVSNTANLPSTSNLKLNGGVLELAGDIALNYGTGAGQVQWTSAGGFSAFGGNRTVNYNGGAAVTWGSNFAMTGQSLLLSSASSDSKVTFANAIDLGGAVRTVTTADGSAAVDAELSGALSNGGITISGAGTILLSGANTYSGITTVNGGNLEIASTLGSTAASSLVILNGTLRSTGTGGSTNQLFQIGNSNTADVSATLDSSGSGAIEFSNSGSILYANANRTRQFNFTGTNTGDNIFRPSIGNSGTAAVRVNKDGTGKWVLSGSNSYSDVTYIYEGTLSIASDWALGNTSSVNMLSGATLDLDNVNTGSKLFYLSGSGVNGGGSLTVAGTSTISGTIRLDSSVDLVIGGAGTLNLNAYVREIFGGSVLTKVGSGTLVVNNPGIPDGLEYQINQGTVLLNSANITSISGTLATVNNGATLRIVGGNGNQINNYAGVRVNSGGLFDLNSRNEAIALLLGSGTVTNTALGTSSTLTIGDPDWNPDSTFSGMLQDGAGTVALVKTGTGSFTLSGSNNYTGGTTVNGGLLVRDSANAFVNNTAYTVNGGTMALNNYDLTASSFRGTGGAVSLGSANLTVNQSGNTTYAGRIFGTGGLTKQGAGTLTLSGSNTYTGGTTVNDGLLVRGGVNAFVNNTAYTVNGGTMALNNFDLTASSFRGTGGAVSLGSANLTVNQSGNTTYSGRIFGTGGLTKQGAGTLTLDGGSSYTGTTTVQGGKLIVEGDNSAATGDVVVEDTAVLGGSGTIGGNTTIRQGGILTPGSSPGTLTFANNLAMEDGSILFFEAGDLVDVGGLLTLGNDWTLALTDGFQDGGSVVLFTYDSFSDTGLTPTFDISGLGFTPTGPLSLTDTGSSIVLNGVSVVPEPSALFLLAGAGVLLAARRRRRAGR